MLHPILDVRLLRYGYDTLLEQVTRQRLVRAARAGQWQRHAMSTPGQGQRGVRGNEQPGRDLLSPQERARLDFLRWLYRTGRLAP